MTIHGGELHKFIFEGLPVRGVLVRLTGAWTEMLARRQAAGGYPAPVRWSPRARSFRTTR